MLGEMISLQPFKVGRSERVHSNHIVVRVYQVFGTHQFGWDTHHQEAPPERPFGASEAQAGQDAEDSLRQAGHKCDPGCHQWRTLE